MLIHCSVFVTPSAPVSSAEPGLMSHCGGGWCVDFYGTKVRQVCFPGKLSRKR